MRCRMQSAGLLTHDKLLTSSIYSKVGVNLGMPAVTVQSQAFDDTLMQDTALMKKVPLKDEINTQCDVHAQCVLQLLQLQRKAGFLCDITIHVKDRSFKAHKPLLAACSKYFRSLFADSDSKESTALNLVPLTPTGFEILLDYIYSGNLAITPDNCSAVLAAAICLQMTNVVETCKKFMQSTFQMNSNQDLMKLHVDNPTSDEIHHHLLKNSKNAKAPVHYPENNSIGFHLSPEKDSQVSLVKSFLRSQSVDSEEHDGGKYSLPNAIQLQSVLPILMSNHPRQPTPMEVQNTLASFPNAAELMARYRLLNSSAAKKHSNSNNSNQKQQGQNQEVYSSALRAQTSPHLMIQNGHASTHSPPVFSSASFVQDYSTLYPAAQPLKTAEHGSGFAPTTNELANHKNGKRRHHERKNIPLRSTSRDPNCIEISSDDDGGRSVWSADRSVPLIPDLSGTPCATASHSAISPPFNLTHSKLACPDTEEDYKAPVSKALSLPSLSGSPAVQSLSRARSAEQCDGKSWLDLKFFKKSGSSDEKNSVEEENKDSASVSEQASDILSPTNEGMAETEATRSVDGNEEERNFVLDLSVAGNLDSKEKPKINLDTRAFVLSGRPECDSHSKEVSRRSSITSSFSDPGMRIAADALSMLKQSKAKGCGSPSFDYQIHSVASDSSANESKDNQSGGSVWDDDVTSYGTGSDQSSPGAAKQAAFSRKPRRTTGGQTCTWPGCKRLFRHRNIYEEHQRMHERGVPASQLRKCYMGARVKKTVREQLEEMRMNDVFDGVNEADSTKINRARKRKSNSDSHEPLRKRVNVKDRVANLQFAPVSSALSSVTKKPLQSTAPSSYSQSYEDISSKHMKSPALNPAYSGTKVIPVVGPDGVVKFAHCNDATTSPSSSQPPCLTLAASPYSIAMNAVSSVPNGISVLSQLPITSAGHMQRVNPVAALALLGMSKSLRPNDNASTSTNSTSSSPIDQITRSAHNNELLRFSKSPPALALHSSIAMTSLKPTCPSSIVRETNLLKDDLNMSRNSSATSNGSLISRSNLNPSTNVEN